MTCLGKQTLAAWMPLLLVVVCSTSCNTQPQANGHAEMAQITDTYLAAWRDYYPSRAFAAGDRPAAFQFENFSTDHRKQWLATNQATQRALVDLRDLRLGDEADRKLLLRRIESELETWGSREAYKHRPGLYAGQLAQGLTHVLVRDNLDNVEKLSAVHTRLNGMIQLVEQARANLVSGPEIGTQGSIRTLRSTATFFRGSLQEIMADWSGNEDITKHKTAAKAAANAAEGLANFLESLLSNGGATSDVMGLERYTAIHARNTGDGSTPEELAGMALAEIATVRGEMREYAMQYWQESQPEEPPPENFAQLLDHALTAMEANRDDNQADFEETFTRLTNEAETFVREHRLGTVPDPRTLHIGMSPPHFAGAAVGGVYTAGPFNPEAQTLFYLPSVPDDAPETVKTNFYRSFNTHFNTMIISHEMFPGHYMQFKIATRGERPVRGLFADGIYVEGWGSFCELLMLAYGWDDRNTLTYLAHLRKALENAVRAYVSVKVHCDGWDRDQVVEFAVERGLLAPQFAENLWNRVIRSPHQLYTYFLGFHQFKSLYESEQRRLGDQFDIQQFVDGVLELGAVPMTDLEALLHAKLAQSQ